MIEYQKKHNLRPLLSHLILNAYEARASNPLEFMANNIYEMHQQNNNFNNNDDANNGNRNYNAVGPEVSIAATVSAVSSTSSFVVDPDKPTKRTWTNSNDDAPDDDPQVYLEPHSSTTVKKTKTA